MTLDVLSEVFLSTLILALFAFVIPACCYALFNCIRIKKKEKAMRSDLFTACCRRVSTAEATPADVDFLFQHADAVYERQQLLAALVTGYRRLNAERNRAKSRESIHEICASAKKKGGA